MTQGLELRGAVLGKGYRLGRKLDADDAETYEATHERIPGRFIVRLFPPEALSHPEAASRIQRAARVASLLRDSRAVQILDCNVSGETPAFVVSERVTGRSLAEVMADDGMLSLPRVVELVESIAAAISAGHKIGLVHGDIRPAHVILPTSGLPPAKLSGFGWAKELRAAARVPAPSGYLAPEQNHGQVLTLDERVDQFGLAALTYEMIAACLPFPEEEKEEGAELADGSVTKRVPTAITDLVPGVPRALDDVLRRALAASPSERFSDVVELAARLRATTLSPTGVAQDGEHASGSASRPRSAAGAGVTAARAQNEVTKEPDFAAFSRMEVDGDSFEDGGDSENQGVETNDDENEDALLVLGELPPATATTTDNARTQVVRSPFFESSELGDPSSARPMGPATPLRGMPLGRPSVATGTQGTRSGGVPIGSGPLRGSRLGSHPQSSDAENLSHAAWFRTLRQRKWFLPALSVVGLLVIVATIIRISGGSRPNRAIDDVRRVATVPTTPPPVLTTIPAAPSAPSTAQGVDTGGARSDRPQPSSAEPNTGSGPAAPSATADRANQDAAPDPIAARAEPMPPTTSQQAPTADGQDAAGARSRASRPLRRQPQKAPLAVVPQPVKTSPPAPGRPSDCSIRISSKPWAEVWIDGKNTGRKTPIDNMKVACGTHKLELKRPDQDIEQMEMLNVVAGKPYRGNYDLE